MVNFKKSFLKVGGLFLPLTSPVLVTFTRFLACTFRKVYIQQCKLIIFSNFYCIHSCCLNLFSCQICFFVCIYYSSCMHICILLYIHVTVLYHILASFQKINVNVNVFNVEGLVYLCTKKFLLLLLHFRNYKLSPNGQIISFIGAQAHLQTQPLRAEWYKVLKIIHCRIYPIE